EPDQRVEELLLLLQRRVARADVRRLAVDPLLELAERDRDVVDLRERRLELLGALLRSGAGATRGRREGVRIAGLIGFLLATDRAEPPETHGRERRRGDEQKPNHHNKFN